MWWPSLRFVSLSYDLAGRDPSTSSGLRRDKLHWTTGIYPAEREHVVSGRGFSVPLSGSVCSSVSACYRSSLFSVCILCALLRVKLWCRASKLYAEINVYIPSVERFLGYVYHIRKRAFW